MAGPLSHVRVLDLSRIMAGPWAGQILADLGADVVKVERPGAGDDTRGWGPPFLKDRSGAETREAGYYLVGQSRQALDHARSRQAGGPAASCARSRSAPTSCWRTSRSARSPRFGLGYEQLKAVNPKLIYCSITGFGQTGPRRDAAGLRLHDPGHVRPDERHRRARRQAGRLSRRRSACRSSTSCRACTRRSPCWRRWRAATRPAAATTSTSACSTSASRSSPTRR